MQKVLVLVVLLFASHWVSAQQAEQNDAPPPAAPATQEDDVKETTVLGCLSNQSGEFTLTDASGTLYRLPGDNGLDPYVGHEVSIGGTTSVSAPEPTITVTEIKDVLDPSAPVASFAPTDWKTSSNKTYGFSVQYPETFNLLEESELRKELNFANSNGALSLLSVEIPDEIYPGSNFRGGYFTVGVNPSIANAQACVQFGYADPQFVSSRAVHNIKYSQATEGEGAAGTAYQYYYLHTYQNNLCYEFKLEVAAVNTGAFDLPCSIHLISQHNKDDLLESFLSRVSFVHPTVALSQQRTRVLKPAVTTFAATSRRADHSLEVTVNWSTLGVDYVHLEFECNNNLVVTGASAYLECGSSSNRNFSPSGTATFLVSNPKGHAAVPFVIRMEPFSRGAAVPSLNKSASVPVTSDPL
jgi:hypothetical protein